MVEGREKVTPAVGRTREDLAAGDRQWPMEKKVKK